MLYTRKYPTQCWNLWADLLAQQIQFDFLMYRICEAHRKTVFESPDKKHQVIMPMCNFCASNLNVIITTNSGSFHIVAEKKLEMFEVTLIPCGLYCKWHIVSFFRYLREHHLLMMYLSKLCLSEFFE